jgi:hypothetical protein
MVGAMAAEWAAVATRNPSRIYSDGVTSNLISVVASIGNGSALGKSSQTRLKYLAASHC